MRRNGKPRNHSPPNAPKEFAEGQRNLHIHVLLTMRPLTENGEKIPVIDKKTGQQKVDKQNRKQWKCHQCAVGNCGTLGTLLF